MAEDRMLNDEILLGLIKANSGGGGGGTTNYNDLSNKPQIDGVELKGNKTLADLGIASASALADKQNATDNNLDTEAKTIVGAINEHEGDIVSLKSGFTALDNEVNGSATTYPYADVITIEDAVPANLADCSVKVEPVQSGTGTPSPENVRPITGHTKCVVTRASQNMAGNLTQGYWAAADGAATQSQEWVRTDKLACIPNRTYRILSEHLTRWTTCCVYDSQGTFLEVLGEASGSAAHKVDVTVTVPSNAYYMGWSIANPVRPNPLTPSDITDLKLFDASTIAQYTLALGDTIYGGTVRIDSNGNTVMDVNNVKKVVDGTETVSSYGFSEGKYGISISGISNANRDNSNISDRLVWHQVSDYTTLGDGEFMIDNIVIVRSSSFPTTGAEDMKTYLAGLYAAGTPLEFLFKLATPTTIQLTPEQIQLLQGTNTIYASTGDISVTVNGVSGAIGQVQEQVNDHEERIDGLESGLTNLDNEVNGDATTYPYADVITINDAVPSNLAECSVKIEPVQDLHGYDKPWVGGAGDNKFSGSDNTYTRSDQSATKWLFVNVPLSSEFTGAYYISFDYLLSEVGETGEALFYGYSNGTQITGNICKMDDKTTSTQWKHFSGLMSKSVTFDAIGCYSDDLISIKNIMVSASEPTTFAPYTNICPISGHTEAVVTVADDDTDPTVTNTYTIALGDTIYGGTVDFDSGVMTVDRAYAEYTDGTGWHRASNDPGAWFFCFPSGCVADSINLITDKFVAAYTPGVYNTAWIKFNQLHIKPDANIAPSGSTEEGLEEFKTWLSNNHLQVVYPLATPFTVQLSPQQIQLLKGQNTLYASTGDISVTVNGVSGAIGSVQEQVNELAEDVAEIKPMDYSTTEQKTGRKWYDGKDIYQKVYTLNNPLVLKSQDWTDTGFDGSNIGTIINAFGVDSNGTYFNFYATKSSYASGKIGLYQTRNTTLTIISFVLEYTKAA